MVTFNKVTLLTQLLSLLLLAFFVQAGAEQLLFHQLPDGPSQRKSHSAIYDSEHNEAVLFGGEGPDSCFCDIWKLSLSSLSWTQVSPTGDIPLSRQAHSAIYDPVNRRMLIFGGTNPDYVFNDLYSLDLNTNIWSKLSPGGILPSPRWNHSAVYNSTDSSMVIFGGRKPYEGLDVYGDSDTTLLNDSRMSNTLFKDQVPLTWFNDLWKLDLKTLTWTQILPPSQLPPAREMHTSTYIPTGNYMVVYAGYAAGLDYGDLWRYDFATNSWSQILPTGEVPLSRQEHSAFYSSSNNSIVVFGGNNHSLRYFGDIWEFDLTSLSWEKVLPYLGRSHQAGIYDPQRQGLIILGGYALNAYYSPYYFGDGYLITPGVDSLFSYGDANCDGDIGVSDVVYIVNYLFKGGPIPCSPSGR